MSMMNKKPLGSAGQGVLAALQQYFPSGGGAPKSNTAYASGVPGSGPLIASSLDGWPAKQPNVGVPIPQATTGAGGGFVSGWKPNPLAQPSGVGAAGAGHKWNNPGGFLSGLQQALSGYQNGGFGGSADTGSLAGLQGGTAPYQPPAYQPPTLPPIIENPPYPKQPTVVGQPPVIPVTQEYPPYPKQPTVVGLPPNTGSGPVQTMAAPTLPQMPSKPLGARNPIPALKAARAASLAGLQY